MLLGLTGSVALRLLCLFYQIFISSANLLCTWIYMHPQIPFCVCNPSPASCQLYPIIVIIYIHTFRTNSEGSHHNLDDSTLDNSKHLDTHVPNGNQFSRFFCLCIAQSPLPSDASLRTSYPKYGLRWKSQTRILSPHLSSA